MDSLPKDRARDMSDLIFDEPKVCRMQYHKLMISEVVES